MYPASEVENGNIRFEDLPDEIVAGSAEVTLQKATSPLDASGQVGVPYLVYYGGVGEGVGIETGSNLWSNQIDNSFGSVERGCLISYLPPETQGGDPFVPDPDWYVDDFADTYTVTWDGFGIDRPPLSAVVTRVSLCIWEGVDICGNLVALYYSDPGPGGIFGYDYKWNTLTNSYSPAGNEDPCILGINQRNICHKEDFQNTPIGFYPKIFGQGPATVS